MATVNIAQAEQMIINMFKANVHTNKVGNGIILNPFIKAAPAVGKSATMRSIAKKFNLKLIDIRLSQEDPVCLNGALSVQGERSTFLPPERFPLTTDVLPLLPEFESTALENDYKVVLASGDTKAIEKFQTEYCYTGFLIFFDELPDAPRALQSSAYKILLEREIGIHKIHEKAFMAAAGNRVADQAGASGELSSALKSRLVHINVESDSELFQDNISKWGWDLRIQAYLNFKPTQVNTFKQYLKGSADDTYCSERTWDMVNSYLRALHPDQAAKIPNHEITTLTGMIGSHASEFVSFTNLFDNLPTMENIKKNPLGTDVPDNEGAKYLLITMLASQVTEDNHLAFMDYVNRLGLSFTYPFIKMSWSLGGDDVINYSGFQPYLNKFAEFARKQ